MKLMMLSTPHDGFVMIQERFGENSSSRQINLRKRRRIGGLAFGKQLRSGLLIGDEEFALFVEKLFEHFDFILARMARCDQTKRPSDSRLKGRTAFLEHALADETRGFSHLNIVQQRERLKWR